MKGPVRLLKSFAGKPAPTQVRSCKSNIFSVNALFEDVPWKHCIRKFAKKASCFPIRS